MKNIKRVKKGIIIKYNGSAILNHKINLWNNAFQTYNEDKWMEAISQKINTGLAVTQEVCDGVITPLVEKQLNGLNEHQEDIET